VLKRLNIGRLVFKLDTIYHKKIAVPLSFFNRRLSYLDISLFKSTSGSFSSLFRSLDTKLSLYLARGV